jgi:hypothetical protein
MDDGTPRFVVDEESANRAQGIWEEKQRQELAREATTTSEESAPADAICVATNGLTELPECFYDSNLRQVRSSRTSTVTTTGALYKTLYSFEAHDRSAEETLALMAREHISLLPKIELSGQGIWRPKRKDILAAEQARTDAAEFAADVAHLRTTHDRLQAEENRRVALSGQRTSERIADRQLSYAERQANSDRREREALRKVQLEGGPRMDISSGYEGLTPPNADELDIYGRPKKRKGAR